MMVCLEGRYRWIGELLMIGNHYAVAAIWDCESNGNLSCCYAANSAELGLLCCVSLLNEFVPVNLCLSSGL